MKKILIGFVIILVLMGAGYAFFRAFNTPQKIVNENPIKINSELSETEARVIAQKTCIKGGEALAQGKYNQITKTWWFDANLNSTKKGCNPACVVSEKTRTAEINWRCTGAILE